MHESIGYTVTLNIMIVFIVIIFFFITGVFMYFKENKTNNIITDALERHEGYNDLAQQEIENKITSIGYNKNNITCSSTETEKGNIQCNISTNEDGIQIGDKGSEGYCIYICTTKIDNEYYYYYKVRTNMQLNIPIIGDIVNVPIYTNTSRFYDFEKNLTK